MPPLAERLRGFGAALLDPAQPVPAGLVGPDGEPCPKRFAVYRNNVAVALIKALKANFPAVARIVGDEFFRAMARTYIVAGPAASPMLFEYGAGFADFIAGFKPAGPLPYLTDVARIERAWTEAYHAAEATPLAPEALAAIAGEWIGDTRFSLHPSLRVVRSRWPALTVWRMNVADGVPAPVDLDAGGEDTLVIRPDAEVEVRAMPGGGAAFVGALAGGRTLAQAVDAALVADAEFDLAANIAGLIDAGAFVGRHSAEDTLPVQTRRR